MVAALMRKVLGCCLKPIRASLYVSSSSTRSRVTSSLFSVMVDM